MNALAEVLREVEQINRLCSALRAGYLKHHPDAPRSPWERELAALWEEVYRQRPELPGAY